ncbi:DUF5367 family protein [Phenylobacterium montanum]|uniref:DUF5367 family protein n=1 Tax=Phenylobacterium montanum TaxID=2823693 RepID=A0A975IV31_9CAUL|nr:DUF5367 family protein [Caulobacter sp. S6]QUD88365.1 DUF5367 family protein [Caulobacter sp. S6]
MTRREALIYAGVGFSVWLNGAVTFRLGGRMLFTHGPAVTAAVALVIAALVCLALRATMAWRKADVSQSVEIAVIMALPGLFGETARLAVFPWATGLPESAGPSFAAVIFFGNAVLLAYAYLRAQQRHRPPGTITD